MAYFGEVSPIVCDCGSGMIKIGLANAGDHKSAVVLPTVVGRRRPSPFFTGRSDYTYVGGELHFNTNIYSLSYPMERGVVSDWDDMEKIWHHAFFDELQIDPQEHPVLLSEAPLNPKRNREKMVHVMFETFCVPATYVTVSALLSLYSCNRTTDSGHGVSHAVPIYEGYVMHEGIIRTDLAGLDLNDALKKFLARSGYRFKATSEREIVTDIKEKLCFVALDYEQELEKTRRSSATDEIYELPDGLEITIGEERLMCPEVLFRPSLIEDKEEGIHQIIHKSIMQCEVDTRRQLRKNIMLTGGSMMFPGIADRVRKEITALAPSRTNVNVDAFPDPLYSAWIGGCILANHSSFQKQWITKEQYDEVGPSIAHQH